MPPYDENSFMNEGGFFESQQKEQIVQRKTLRMLTAKQLLNPSSDAPEIAMVEIVGFVTGMKKTSTGIIFTLYDTTAEIECAFWLNSNYDEQMFQAVQENSLIKAIGNYRKTTEKKTVAVGNVKRVEINKLIHHLTTCLFQHLINNNKITLRKPVEKVKTTSDIEKDIINLIKANEDNSGIHIDTVIAMLSSNYTENEVRSAVEKLNHNCYLYVVEGENYKVVS
ncbi:hypothetical protein NUSPORA_01237 [Nucleospora cyclopteri]